MLILSRRAALISLASLTALPVIAQPTAPALHARLQPLARFVGTWRGTGKGQPGESQVERSYTPVLGGRFIECRHRSTYPPQDANPKGEVHDDIGYLSHDNARRRFVLRQFHVEGFVNQYAAAAPDFVDNKLVFLSEALENIPASMKARETYLFTSADAFEEVFEVAEDGATFEVYSHNWFKRA